MKISLYKHQQEAVEFIINRGGSGALFMDIGTGKTAAAIGVFEQLRKKHPNLKMLVVCPISLINAAWRSDVEKFSDFTFHSLRETKFKPADIYAINFESFITDSMATKIIDLSNTGPLLCVVDESQRLKNSKSQISKQMLAMQSCFDFRVIMSGCAAPNGYHEYHAQMRFIDPTIFHKSNSAFMSEFFHLQRGNQVMPAGIMNKSMAHETFSKGFKYAITPQNKERLLNIVKPYCFFADIDKCLDLPKVTSMVRDAYMTPALRKVYNELDKTLVTEIQGYDIASPVALAKIMKLRELCGGFIFTPDGKILEVDCPKIEILKEILEDAGDKQVIIWNNFTWEAKKICKELGIEKCAILNGDIKDKDKEIKDFQEGRRQYLVAHPKSGGAGLTFVNSCLMIDYSLDYSFDNRIQTQGRFRRPGQESKHLTRIRIIMKGSIDEIIYGVIEGKYQENEIVRRYLQQQGESCNKQSLKSTNQPKTVYPTAAPQQETGYCFAGKKAH